MSAVEVSTHVQAVVDHLNDAELEDDWYEGAILFGRGRQPDGTGWQGTPTQSPFRGYGIVWRIGSKDSRNLSLDDDAGTEARPLIYVRVFGGFPTQADDILDLAHARMMDGTFSVPGRRLVKGSLHLDNGQTSTKTEDVEYTLFEAGNFYRFRTVPLTSGYGIDPYGTSGFGG